jgi:transposase
LIWPDDTGSERFEIKEYEAFTDDLIRLREWLFERECPIVVMESTGPYWTPIHNILEGYFRVILVNPRYIKNVPGRKTDISDSRWLAGLLRHGLVRASFIPPKFQRQWRDLTRMRTNYVKSLGDFKRRVHKLLQSANLKIDSVLSNLFGLTGRNLLKLLADSESELTLAHIEGCLKGRLTKKAKELHRAVQGYFEKHHRDLLYLLLKTIEGLEGQISLLEQRIQDVVSSHQDTLNRLMAVPGIAIHTAPAILSEVGPTLETFDTAAAFLCWSGICPGNNESAGKRRSGRSRVTKNHLKEIMIEVAWAAVKKKGSYFRAKYYAIRARLGPKKAIVAVAHRILKAVYHIIKHGATFKDLGEDYLLNRNKESKLKYLRKQASLLGFELTPLNQEALPLPSTVFPDSQRSIAN